MKLSSTTVRLILASSVLLGLGAYFINASVSWYDTPEGKGYDSPGGIAEGRPILSSEESIELIMAQKDKERWKDQLAVACFIASGVIALGATFNEVRIRQA